MSADWEEVKRLAADFQRAQLTSTASRLSDRNCIEIVKKLIEIKLIDVIFTNDGKEYLTPNRLLKEIRDELIVHDGRINLVDLAQIIGVDYNHVESKAAEFLQSEPNTCMVLGQLITNDYLDHLAEDVNEKLHQIGEINIAEITKWYDLPGDFLEQTLHERLGTILIAEVDSADSRTFFTEAYLAQHSSKIRGALSALTRPIPLASVINHFKFPEKLFYRVAEGLVKENQLAGSISGGRSERAIFIPDIYSKSQNEWIMAFYNQNGYLEYDAVARLGILDAKVYLKKKFKEEPMTFLTTCCVGKNIINQIEASIEEALNCKTWVDVLPILPSVFTPEDCQGIITLVTKSIAKQGSVIHVYCDTFVVSDEFVKECQNNFEPLMQTKAKNDIAKSPHLFSASQASRAAAPSSKKEKEAPISKGKQDRKEERKKKASAGKAGGGTQGRETRTKNVKKKYLAGRDGDDSDEEEEVSPPKEMSLTFMDVNAIEKHIQSLESFKDCPEDLASQLASQMYRPLSKRYNEVAKALYESTAAASGSSRRKQHAECQEKFSMLLNHINIFERATKLFSDDVSSQLIKHLLKTLCTDLTNSVVLYLAQEQGVSSPTDTESTMSAEIRTKLISKFPEDIRQSLTKLHTSLNAKTVEDFQSTIEVVLGAGICDMIIRKPDKKKERLILANHRQSLLGQLNDSSDPALCLHLAVLVIFQSHTHNMLHASGKFVPHIIGYLQRQVPADIYQLLATYQESVIKKLTPCESKDANQASDSFLTEMMPKIKETAVMYKKTSISESEN